MNVTRTPHGPLPRRLLALGLVAWLAGLGCALGCGAASASAVGAGAGAESPAESCAAMPAPGGHGCCHRAQKRGGEPITARTPARPGGPNMRCPLARQTSDPARKVRTSDDAPATAKSPARTHRPEPGQFHEANAPRPRAHDRGGTYLRCCVFLI